VYWFQTRLHAKQIGNIVVVMWRRLTH